MAYSTFRVNSIHAQALSVGLPWVLRLGGRRGILISRLHHVGHPPVCDPGGVGVGTEDLQAGDVLLTFNGHGLDELGFTELFGRRLHFGAARDLCPVGSEVELLVLRQGEERRVRQARELGRALAALGAVAGAAPGAQVGRWHQLGG